MRTRLAARNEVEERLTYTIEEAARLLGIGRNSAYQAAVRGDIPTIRIGRRLLVPKTRLEALVNGSAKC